MCCVCFPLFCTVWCSRRLWWTVYCSCSCCSLVSSFIKSRAVMMEVTVFICLRHCSVLNKVADFMGFGTNVWQVTHIAMTAVPLCQLWTEGQWDRFCLQYLGFPVSVLLRKCSALIFHSFIYYRRCIIVQLKGSSNKTLVSLSLSRSKTTYVSPLHKYSSLSVCFYHKCHLHPYVCLPFSSANIGHSICDVVTVLPRCVCLSVKHCYPSREEH